MRLWWVLRCHLRNSEVKQKPDSFDTQQVRAACQVLPVSALTPSLPVAHPISSGKLPHRATPHPDGSPLWHLQLVGRVGFCSMTRDTDVLCRAPLARFTGADGERPARVLAHPHEFSVIYVGPCSPSIPPRTEHLCRLTTQPVMIQHHFHKPEPLI